MNLNFHRTFIILPLLLIGLAQGCSTTSGSASGISNLVIAEPMAINPQSELALARLSEILQRVEVTEEQRAKLFYDRGVIFDSVGLRSLASFDFQRALRIRPDLVDAYNFMGIHHTQRQEFNLAYEAFDSAIELEPDHQYAYLNRGIALYYGGRPEMAVKDIEKFQLQEQYDPYRMAWLYLVEYEIDPQAAQQHLQDNYDSLPHNSWANNILRLFLGEMTEGEFIDELTLGVTSNKELTDRLCEGYFYLGKYNLINDLPNNSANYFKLALSTNVYEFIEHRYAKLELDILTSKFAQPISESEVEDSPSDEQ
ncbi:lipoprotein NlpI [Thalassotalea mangrovi]|uniref:lipoprotein NlpI n=1 Tax=Thalassotalea mangrovi TaxID=2572245 RepID=UPI001FE2F2E5|nr:lipoprotein NlpI [Thalassotalea mangrovi]